MVKLSDLQKIENTAQPTPGMGLVLDTNGQLPQSVNGRNSSGAHKLAVQAIPNAVLTQVLIDVIDWQIGLDSGFGVNTLLAQKMGGIYLSTATATWAANPVTYEFNIAATVGVAVPNNVVVDAASGGLTNMSVSGVFSMTSTGALGLFVYQTSGGPLNLTLNSWTLTRIA